ncbi:maintenance of telomere capping protein 1 [Protomyces lactucae-debilis]|uniref:Maintenance of telomere capping protein 1 n=1 Tax=Protomyces lactucae-debilis TaxID=2754530 RepID=A0A1Y2F995_PROLT|nr:maintenance of telomere capping protein 1 [Protomyces lactucae-debilis]ORY80443.1 maintenance of telomere capping protein 1 [Protomyces lactucae-debilis]
MASKKSAQDLLAGFDDLPDDTNATPTTTDTPNNAKSATTTGGDDDEANINEFLAEFSRDRPSRPHTPRTNQAIRSSAAVSASVSKKASPRSSSDAVTAPTAGNSGLSGEARTASPATSITETKSKGDEAPTTAASSWGSWGGSLWNTASALAAQTKHEAEKRLAELQQSEEAQKLQARLRAVDLAKIAAEARTLGQGVLDAVAPPIAGAEVLIVHVTHDLQGVRVKKGVEEAFERVMEQVEGGHLTVLAKDFAGDLALELTQGGLKDARKLCEATVEDLMRDTADAGAIKAEEKGEAEANAVPTASHIYLAIQAYTTEDGAEEGASVVQMLLTLTDPANKIKFAALSQAVPQSWLQLAQVELEAETQPVEWVADLLTQSLTLATGVLAQRYVARRMGIDESKTAPGTPKPGQSSPPKAKLASKQAAEAGSASLGL